MSLTICDVGPRDGLQNQPVTNSGLQSRTFAPIAG